MEYRQKYHTDGGRGFGASGEARASLPRFSAGRMASSQVRQFLPTAIAAGCPSRPEEAPCASRGIKAVDPRARARGFRILPPPGKQSARRSPGSRPGLPMSVGHTTRPATAGAKQDSLRVLRAFVVNRFTRGTPPPHPKRIRRRPGRVKVPRRRPPANSVAERLSTTKLDNHRRCRDRTGRPASRQAGGLARVTTITSSPVAVLMS